MRDVMIKWLLVEDKEEGESMVLPYVGPGAPTVWTMPSAAQREAGVKREMIDINSVENLIYWANKSDWDNIDTYFTLSVAVMDDGVADEGDWLLNLVKREYEDEDGTPYILTWNDDPMVDKPSWLSREIPDHLRSQITVTSLGGA